jgi:hypothetical protein
VILFWDCKTTISSQAAVAMISSKEMIAMIKFLDKPEMMYCKEIQETTRLMVKDAMTSS